MGEGRELDFSTEPDPEPILMLLLFSLSSSLVGGEARGVTQLGSSAPLDSELETSSSEGASCISSLLNVWHSVPSPLTILALSVLISCSSTSSALPSSACGEPLAVLERTSRTNSRAERNARLAESRKGIVWNTCT